MRAQLSLEWVAISGLALLMSVVIVSKGGQILDILQNKNMTIGGVQRKPIDALDAQVTKLYNSSVQ